jgi:hypothetical protein
MAFERHSVLGSELVYRLLTTWSVVTVRGLLQTNELEAAVIKVSL